MDPFRVDATWSHELWSMLFVIAAGYPDDPTDSEKQQYREHYEALCDVMGPDAGFQARLKAAMKLYPLTDEDTVNSDALSRWVLRLMNSVANTSVTLERMRSTWVGTIPVKEEEDPSFVEDKEPPISATKKEPLAAPSAARKKEPLAAPRAARKKEPLAAPSADKKEEVPNNKPLVRLQHQRRIMFTAKDMRSYRRRADTQATMRTVHLQQKQIAVPRHVGTILHGHVLFPGAMMAAKNNK